MMLKMHEHATTGRQFGLLKILNLQIRRIARRHSVQKFRWFSSHFSELMTLACDGCHWGIQESTSTRIHPLDPLSRSGTAPPSRASQCCAPRRAWPICRWTRWTASGRRWASGGAMKPWKFSDIPKAEAAAAPKAPGILAVDEITQMMATR